MAIVDLNLGTATFDNGASVMAATVPVDDTFIDPVTGDPDPDIVFEGDIKVTVVGPGTFVVQIWRGTVDETKAPWRTSESWFPGGVTAADAPLSDPLFIATGGPVKKLSDIDWITTAAGQMGIPQ